MLDPRRALKWFLALLVPLALIGLGVRLLLTHGYLQLEYQSPGFPADEYGFSTDDRLRWGTYGVDYLLNKAPPEFLGNLQLPGGEPLFTSREVSHMHDVKLVVGGLLRIWYVVMAIILVAGLSSWRLGWFSVFRAGLRGGGILTLIIAGGAGLLGTLGASGSGDLFWEFFRGFHGLFFAGDSWLFSYSDTLIRLYPLRFWQDAIVYLGLLTAIGAISLIVGLRDRATPRRESI